jgi:hypothetical protein
MGRTLNGAVPAEGVAWREASAGKEGKALIEVFKSISVLGHAAQVLSPENTLVIMREPRTMCGEKSVPRY